jgi:hypothetical protein
MKGEIADEGTPEFTGVFVDRCDPHGTNNFDAEQATGRSVLHFRGGESRNTRFRRHAPVPSAAGRVEQTSTPKEHDADEGDRQENGVLAPIGGRSDRGEDLSGSKWRQGGTGRK